MAYRSSTAAAGTGTISSVAVPSGVAADDIVVLVLSRDSTSALGTWPSGFTELLNVALSAVDTQRVGSAWKRATGADSGTYDCGAGASVNWAMHAVVFSGRDTGNPPVLSSTTTDSSNALPTSVTAPSVTALDGDDLLYMCLPDTSAADGSYATSPPSGYTEAQDNQFQFAYAESAYKENVSAGATGSVTGTLSGSGNAGWVAAHVRIPSSSVVSPTKDVTVLPQRNRRSSGRYR